MKATYKSMLEIASIAEKFAADNDYLLGDRLEPFVERIGGKVLYKELENSLAVNGPNDFVITIGYYIGIERYSNSLPWTLCFTFRYG